jgi:acetyl-CoA carboxylase biotin carboxyl carrier protein
MDLTEEEVEKILRLVDELDYGEIHLTIGTLTVDLVKQPAPASVPGETRDRPMPSVDAATTAAHRARGAANRDGTSRPCEPAARAASNRSVGSTAGEALPDGAHIVTAPVAGTFYRAPSPGAKPFVEVGQQVRAPDPVALLEVMKLYHSVPAGMAGRIAHVLVDDATAVVQGQPLIAIVPASAS